MGTLGLNNVAPDNTFECNCLLNYRTNSRRRRRYNNNNNNCCTTPTRSV